MSDPRDAYRTRKETVNMAVIKEREIIEQKIWAIAKISTADKPNDFGNGYVAACEDIAKWIYARTFEGKS